SQLWMWGRANVSQTAGLGSPISCFSGAGCVNAPAVISGATVWAKVAMNDFSAIAIQNSGSIFGWGFNDHGDVVQGTTGTPVTGITPISEPGAVGTLSVVSVAPHTMAVRSDGTLWAAGYNQYGQTGATPGVYTDQPNWVQVSTDTDWLDVSAIGYHT